VRGLYLYCAAADLIAEAAGGEGEPEALEALWERLEGRRVYVTGGVGARWEDEAFGDDYELPNRRAHAETCAAVAHVLWAWRMLQLDGDGRYRDALETTLFNAVLVGAQRTAYPWDGEVAIEVGPDGAAEFTLHLPVPAWAPQPPAVEVNGSPAAARIDRGYLAQRRTWQAGDSRQQRVLLQDARELPEGRRRPVQGDGRSVQPGQEQASHRLVHHHQPGVAGDQPGQRGGRLHHQRSPGDLRRLCRHQPDLG
jgi:DUF1680 family protein